MDIVQIPVLSDNYVYLLHDGETSTCAVVDPAVAEPVEAELKARGWRLTHILNTHHHMDHVGANLALKDKFGCTIIGPKADEARIPGIDICVGEGDDVSLGTAKARVFDVPGHTRGHIAFYFAGDKALFCGDTLFAMGCGRLFEGTPEQMFASLGKFKDLPGDTRVYCAHEYTQSNGRFALSVEPENQALINRMQDVDNARAKGEPTVPSLISEELATNPFMRAETAEKLGEIRRLKDSF